MTNYDTTALGNTIVGILNETDSVLTLIRYFREHRLFEEDIAPCPRDKEKYEYQIPRERWNEATGIHIEMYQLLNYGDGLIWIDRYFDADFMDYDTEKRYVYISLDEPEINEEEHNQSDMKIVG